MFERLFGPSAIRQADALIARGNRTVGLTHWIASGAEDYVRRAVAFSSEKKQLEELRGSLRARMQASPLMDEAGFTRDLENAYRQMWRQYCAQPQGA